MNSSSNAAPAREYRTVFQDEGYVHKFRLEASESRSAHDMSSDIPSVALAPLLGKFALVALVFAGVAAAAARVMT